MLGVVDDDFNFLQGTISSYPSGGTEIGENLMSYAHQNIAATHEFVQKVQSSWGFLPSRLSRPNMKALNGPHLEVLLTI